MEAKTVDYPRAGETIAQAKAAARTISGGYFRAAALRDIASVQATTGDIEGALLTAGEIEESYSRVEALAASASTLAEAENSEQARETIGRALEAAEVITSPYVRTKALLAIARTFLEAT